MPLDDERRLQTHEHSPLSRNIRSRRILGFDWNRNLLIWLPPLFVLILVYGSITEYKRGSSWTPNPDIMVKGAQTRVRILLDVPDNTE